jgi:glycosyltransferase involved in cell wall biosynthesis
MVDTSMSVLMTCHDRVGDLERALSGLVAGGFGAEEVEIILIDNNSTEPIEAVRKKFKGKLRLLLLLRPELETPLGLASARNLGLKLARSKWIVSIDPDCIVGVDYLTHARRRITALENDLVMITGERLFVDGCGLNPIDLLNNPALVEALPRVRSQSNHYLRDDRRMPGMTQLPAIPHPWDYMHGCNLIYPARTARMCGGHDESFDNHHGYEDIEFAYRMIDGMGCIPEYDSGLKVYHQEPRGSDPQPNRENKLDNANWSKICNQIGGYREFKISEYRRLGISPQI